MIDNVVGGWCELQSLSDCQGPTGQQSIVILLSNLEVLIRVCLAGFLRLYLQTTKKKLNKETVPM